MLRGLLLTIVLLLASVPAFAQTTAPSKPGLQILQDLKSFATPASVLMVAAHPDDENTQLITYLARGRGYRMAYLSVTRGDGGQNVLGPEFGEELGAIRTQELLSARRLDGGRQFFTSAIDFGFSKDYRETLGIWDKDAVLGDVVRVIRTFRPDVIVTRFSTVPGNTHGHHTASAVLALEAFSLSGDPKAYPEQLTNGLTPWQARRIFMNSAARGAGAGPTTSPVVRIDDGGNDPVTGESFASIARRSRAMHKSQGFGNFAPGGGGGGTRQEAFTLLAGESASKDIMDGVDTTWTRYPGGAELQPLIDVAIAKFDLDQPVNNVDAILNLRSKLKALPADVVVDEKRGQLDRILTACLGLKVQTVVPMAEVVSGEDALVSSEVTLQSNADVRWVSIGGRDYRPRDSHGPIKLKQGTPESRMGTLRVRTGAVPSQPYWLREPGTPGMFRVDDASLIGRPENLPVLPVTYVFDIAGQQLEISDEPVQKYANRMDRRIDVIAPVSLSFGSQVRLFTLGSARSVDVTATAYHSGSDGTMTLQVPAGWAVTPAQQPFHLANSGDKVTCSFNVTAPATIASVDLRASVRIGDQTYSNQRIEIDYDHIPHILLQPPALLRAVSTDLAIHGKNIGYVAGAGDSVAEAIMQMGYNVTQLTGDDLTPEKLRGLDAVVIGVRAFNVRKDLAANLPVLFGYVESGGNVIVQYNRPDGLQTNQLAPFDLRLSSDRVTDETAAMTFLAPDHPVLNTPNKITQADFTGWVQERGIYYPSQWAPQFTPILACADPGEQPLKGGILVAQHGKGYFVYTSLVFFRQLPAGVPGAFRLFANMISLGK